MTLTCHHQHIGSLLKPAELISARASYAEGKISDSELKEVEDNSIKYALKIQDRTDCSLVNDGEYQRANFWETFFEGLNGFERTKGRHHDRLRPFLPWGYVSSMTGEEIGEKAGYTFQCTGRISYNESVSLRELKRLQTLIPESQWPFIKLTLASPAWHHIRFKPGCAFLDSNYTDDEEYFADIVTAFREELQILYDNGLRNVQIDCPEFSFFCDEGMRAAFTGEGVDPDELLVRYIKLFNDCVQTKPDGLETGVHICRGNFESQHFASGGYSRIAKTLFSSLNTSTFLLEYDTERAGDFTPLEHLPPTANVVLGIVSTKNGALETFPGLKQKILEAADIIARGAGESQKFALQRISVSPQCGFASSEKGNDIDEVGMLLKLMLVRDLSQEIWS